MSLGRRRPGRAGTRTGAVQRGMFVFAFVLMCPPDLPMPVTNPAVVVADDAIIVLGGNDAVSRREVWRFANAGWDALPPMRQARLGHAAAVFDGRVWVFGGIDRQSGHHDRLLAGVESLDLTTLQWRDEPDMPVAIARFGAVVINASLFVLGGMTETADTSQTALRYDFATASWAAIPQLPVTLNRLSAIAVNGQPAVLGGQSDSATAVRSVLALTPVGWQSLSSLSKPRKNFAVAAHRAQTWIIGGWNDRTGAPEFFNDTELWPDHAGPPLQHARDGVRAAVFKNEIVILGGYGSTGLLSSVECIALPRP